MVVDGGVVVDDCGSSGQRKVETQKRARMLVVGVSRGCISRFERRKGGRGGWLKVETPKTSAHLWNFKGLGERCGG